VNNGSFRSAYERGGKAQGMYCIHGRRYNSGTMTLYKIYLDSYVYVPPRSLDTLTCDRPHIQLTCIIITQQLRQQGYH